jgi:type I site-specific restriction endonuclease
LCEKNKNNDFWDDNIVSDIIDASKELFNILEKMEKNNELVDNDLDILSEEEQSLNFNNNIKNEDLMDEEKD